MAQNDLAVTNLRLEKLALINFGPFRDTEIHFGEKLDEKLANVHILTGPNGSGKSCMLDGLAEIFRVLSGRFGSISNRFRRDSAVFFVFDGLAGQYGPDLLVKSATRWGSPKLRVSGESFGHFCCDSDELWEFKHVAQNPQNPVTTLVDFAAFAYSGNRSLQVQPIDGIKPLHQAPFQAALEFGSSVRPGVLTQWIANNRTQWALATADGDLEAASIYQASLARVTDFISDVCDQKVEFRLNRSPLAVSMSLNGSEIPLEVLPDGLKSILSWVSDLFIRLEQVPWKNAIDVTQQRVFLLLDEIDVHLHPKWQRLVLPVLQKLLPNGEIFVSTHSPFVVGSVENAWVYQLPEKPSEKDLIVARPSGAGHSYMSIVKDVFQVDEEFDPETEALLDQLYQERNQLLGAPEGDLELLKSLGRALAERSEEASVVVRQELRQLSKRIGKDVCLS